MSKPAVNLFMEATTPALVVNTILAMDSTAKVLVWYIKKNHTHTHLDIHIVGHKVANIINDHVSFEIFILPKSLS